MCIKIINAITYFADEQSKRVLNDVTIDRAIEDGILVRVKKHTFKTRW